MMYQGKLLKNQQPSILVTRSCDLPRLALPGARRHAYGTVGVVLLVVGLVVLWCAL